MSRAVPSALSGSRDGVFVKFLEEVKKKTDCQNPPIPRRCKMKTRTKRKMTIFWSFSRRKAYRKVSASVLFPRQLLSYSGSCRRYVALDWRRNRQNAHRRDRAWRSYNFQHDGPVDSRRREAVRNREFPNRHVASILKSTVTAPNTERFSLAASGLDRFWSVVSFPHGRRSRSGPICSRTSVCVDSSCSSWTSASFRPGPSGIRGSDEGKSEKGGVGEN